MKWEEYKACVWLIELCRMANCLNNPIWSKLQTPHTKKKSVAPKSNPLRAALPTKLPNNNCCLQISILTRSISNRTSNDNSTGNLLSLRSLTNSTIAKYKSTEVPKSSVSIKLSQDHKKLLVDMQNFLKHDWQAVEKIDFTKSLIDDAKWRLFVEKAHLFPNLQILRLGKLEVI